MTKLKNNQLCPGLCSIALAIIFAGCHHKISPVAPISQAPPKAAPYDSAGVP